MYNTQEVTLEQALHIALVDIKSGSVPLLVSEPGIGKTSLAFTLAAALGARLVCIRLNSIPPEEALGLQYIDKETKRTVRYAPSWVPAADGSDGPVLVFFDEFMQAPDEYRKGIMSALLERYIGEHKLPANCMLMTAGNSAEDGSQVYELDRATADRLSIIKIRTDFNQWANEFAVQAGIDLSIVVYLRLRPEHFSANSLREAAGENADDNVILPSPRTWEKVSQFIKTARAEGLGPEETKIGIMGKVGNQIGSAFWDVMGKLEGMPSLEDLLNMGVWERKAATPQDMDLLWAYGQSMIWHATSAKQIHRILGLLDDMAPPPGMPFVETRTHIVETMLKHARLKHGVKTEDEPRIADQLKAWQAGISRGTPSNDTDDEVAPESIATSMAA